MVAIEGENLEGLGYNITMVLVDPDNGNDLTVRTCPDIETLIDK